MSKTYFTTDHEWIRVDGDGIATVGITDYATEQLGDIVYVELPETGRTVSKGDVAVVIESVKAASEVYAPVGGDVAEVNSALSTDASLVGSSENGWLWKMRLSNPNELENLLDEAAYAAHIS